MLPTDGLVEPNMEAFATPLKLQTMGDRRLVVMTRCCSKYQCSRYGLSPQLTAQSDSSSRASTPDVDHEKERETQFCTSCPINSIDNGERTQPADRLEYFHMYGKLDRELCSAKDLSARQLNSDRSIHRVH